MEETQAPAPAAGPRINATDFLAAQRSNRRNTVILVVVMLALGAGVGYGVGWIAIAYAGGLNVQGSDGNAAGLIGSADRKSTRLNSSH